MESKKTDRGFIYIEHETYHPKELKPLVQESSTVGYNEDSFERPGSSYLWIGDEFHLNREQARFLANTIFAWLANKRLPSHVDDPERDPVVRFDESDFEQAEWESVEE